MTKSGLMAVVMMALAASAAQARPAIPPTPAPWTDTSLSPDRRAQLVVQAMTLDEKIATVHGLLALPGRNRVVPPEAIFGAGYVQGVPRLGIPPLFETDASLGVAWNNGLRKDGATAMPSGLAIASTFDPVIAFQEGALIGKEAWSKGFNVMLAGGIDLARDPRNGRNFEYAGEDPLLAGVMVGEAIRGIQSQHIVSTIKHYALNDQETGRHSVSANIADTAMRESDLLAFELAIGRGEPGSVMCAYNLINGVRACEHDYLLNQVLKGDWRYPGWVMSDWGAVYSTAAALNGLDQESGEQLDSQVFFGQPLKDAASGDPRYTARLDDMVWRILRARFAVGSIDNPARKTPIDVAAGLTLAQKIAEQGIVLLANKGVLPLATNVKSIAVIGGNAHIGVLSGGGSSQVAPEAGPVASVPFGGHAGQNSQWNALYMPSSPLAALRAKFPDAQVLADDGSYPGAAAELARHSDIAIVFVTQWMLESFDAPDMTLPNGQDALIAAVAAANPNTIVVLETGGPVAMPWLPNVAAVVEAWYPGIRGGEAIANVLSGDVNPSGRLPMTFPVSEEQLLNPQLPGWGLPRDQRFDVDYNRQGSDVGYRGYARDGVKPLFAFGHGLSYTNFGYTNLKVTGGSNLTVSFTVTNTGTRPGTDVPQVYLTAEPGRTQQRLVGWSKVTLAPGESREVTVTAEPLLLANWDAAAHRWDIPAGTFRFSVNRSAADPMMSGAAEIAHQTPGP
jgi:beta-glucosidase